MYNENDLRRPIDDLLRAPVPPRRPYGPDTAKDYARIIHSRAFRRLQGKTQLFPCGESHLLRTRLTHSLEVAEIASRIAWDLNQRYAAAEPRHKIDISIVAAAALAHDIGHPPFGHQGETVLNEIMSGYGGFEGNAQTLRILTRNENRYSGKSPSRITFDDVYSNPKGLNLLYRTVASVIKYDVRTSINSSGPRPEKGYYATEHGIVSEIRNLLFRGAEKIKTIECQIMDMADDIAYSTYDLEDCIEAEVATPIDVMALSDDEVSAIQEMMNDALESQGYQETIERKDVIYISLSIFSYLVVYAKDSMYELDLESSLLAFYAGTYIENRLFSELSINRRRWAEDFIENSINSVHLRDGWDSEILGLTRIDINTRQKLEIEFLKAFNYIRAIRSKKLRLNDERSRIILNELFRTFMSQPFDKGYDELSLFPQEHQLRYRNLDYSLPIGISDEERSWADEICSPDELVRIGIRNPKDTVLTNWIVACRMRFVCDYISSLTDSEAVETFRKLRSGEVRSVFGLNF